jgi:hypothetical protein
MTDRLYCLSVINNAGCIIAGFSGDGEGGWSHYQTAIGSEAATPGFVEIDGLATNQQPSVSSGPGPNGPIVMAFHGHSSNDLYFASSVDGTVFSQRQLPGMLSNNAPFISVMPYSPTLMMAHTTTDDNEIIVSTSADDGVTWTRNAIGQYAKSAPAIIYTADVSGGSWSPDNFYFLMVFQANDSGNELLLCTSSDGVSWSRGPNTGQQSPVSPSLAPGVPSDGGTNFCMAFLSNNSSNEILTCTSIGGLNWGGATGTGHHCRGAPRVVNIDGVLCLVYLGLSDNNIYMCRSTDGTHWSESQICPGLSAPGATRFSGAPVGTLQPPGTAPAPGVGLGDTHNYYFSDNGRPLRNLFIEITVGEDLIIPPKSTTGGGISFQVNCDSPASTSAKPYEIGWQQYDTHITVDSSQGILLFYRIDNWLQNRGILIGHTSVQTRFPNAVGKLPQGSRLTVELLNDDDDNVVGVTFGGEIGGTAISPYTRQLSEFTTTSGKQVTATDTSPILSFQLDVVSSHNTVTLTKGSGTIKYSAWNLMTASGDRPENVSGLNTGESANSAYGSLNNWPSTVFTQSFGVKGS